MIDVRKLQRHFDLGKPEGCQAKVLYSVGDRVHLKKTKFNGVIVDVIFKEDRSFPYLKIKWDCSVPNDKKFYDPYDIVKEIPCPITHSVKRKSYHNFYLESKR